MQLYGKEHGYGLILGATASGNILYGREIRPVLATLERTYGLSERRTAHIVFSPPDTATHFHRAEWWDVEFRDNIFGTGLQHFGFRREDWERAPGLRR